MNYGTDPLVWLCYLAGIDSLVTLPQIQHGPPSDSLSMGQLGSWTTIKGTQTNPSSGKSHSSPGQGAKPAPSKRSDAKKKRIIGTPAVTSAKPIAAKKRRLKPTEIKVKLIAALSEHHGYGKDDLNQEPIGCRELAIKAGVPLATTSDYFREKFKGHDKYKRMCLDRTVLIAMLRLLNEDVAPHELYGRQPHRERDHYEDD